LEILRFGGNPAPGSGGGFFATAGLGLWALAPVAG
jgi:hypothetical protein